MGIELEKTNEWANLLASGYNLLELVKETNNSEHFLTAQSCILSTIFTQIHEIITNHDISKPKIYFLERSLQSAFEIFTLDAYRNKACSKLSYLSLYYQFKNYEKLVANYFIPVFIFLNTSSQTCMQRLSNRGLNFDNDSFSYIDRINKIHNEFFNSHLLSLCLDGSKVSIFNASIILNHIQKLFPDLKISII